MEQIAREGYIVDFISGIEIKPTPEELNAVQVFSKLLVEDYGYPKKNIQTRPQYRVKIRPSDVRKEYPVDIVVFNSNKKVEDNEYIVIECKKNNRKDGKTQLQNYLTFCNANLGVWFNGNDKIFLRKFEKSGKVYFEEIPNIPKYGERIEDIGLYKRKDLVQTHNLKSIFKSIRNYLAANTVGATRDEVFAQQIINLIFCKIYDERFTKPDNTVTFRAGIHEDRKFIRERIDKLFLQVKKQYNDVIANEDKIELDDQSLAYVVGELQMFCITESERDAIADAFETFIGPSLKGSQGQFFTPRNIVKVILELVSINLNEKVIDPACGSGGFLIESLKTMWRKIDDQGKDYNWPESEIFSEKQKAAIKNIRGIDKDNFLSKVAKSYMAIMGDGRGGVFCQSSLSNPKEWNNITKEHVQLGTFDIVVTNPPFGKKLKIDDTTILSSFNLGYKWKLDKTGECTKTNTLHDGQSPQILFIERCLELLKPGGRLGIIVPESMFCNPSHRYIIKFIKDHAKIKAIISLPEELFQPYTHAKTCAILIVKNSKEDKHQDHEIFMAAAKWCGHDSRGTEIPFDDIPTILSKFHEYKEKGKLKYDHLGFIVKESSIIDNIYLPKYYNPEINERLEQLKKTHQLLRVKSLIQENLIKLTTGHEVGKLAYGTGSIPFIRTSDIANWELKIDAKHGLSNEIYNDLKNKQNIEPYDILMVRDGTYLVGTCAIVTPENSEIVFQSHIYKIRSMDHKKIHPFLLLAIFSTPIVKAQIYSKRFTQDIIDTLGGRIEELILPIPKDEQAKNLIIKSVEKIINLKRSARELTINTINSIAPVEIEDIESSFVEED